MNLPTDMPTDISTNEINQATETWDHLKQAIASSSGFDRWQRTRNVTKNVVANELTGSKNESKTGSDQPDSLLDQKSDRQDQQLDVQVTDYLRETLETLAY